METWFINLFGGPGVGKSTVAAAVFAELKKQGYECELITEYAKDKIWAEHEAILNDQLYIFAKQHNRVWRVNKKVEFAITDSPLLLSLVYANEKDNTGPFRDLVFERFARYNNCNIFIERNVPYSNIGRVQQTEKEAMAVDVVLKNLLQNSVGYINMKYDERLINRIVGVVLDMKRNKIRHSTKGEVR